MATILGTVSELLAHVIAGHTRYATPVVAGVECADGKIRAQQGTDAGAALVSIADSALPALAATSALQSAGNASLATLCPCTLSPSADGTITKSDDTVYDPPLRAIWATGAGNLVVMLSGDTVSIVTIPVTAGEKITWASVRKVMAATTATGISGAR